MGKVMNFILVSLLITVAAAAHVQAKNATQASSETIELTVDELKNVYQFKGEGVLVSRTVEKLAELVSEHLESRGHGYIVKQFERENRVISLNDFLSILACAQEECTAQHVTVMIQEVLNSLVKARVGFQDQRSALLYVCKDKNGLQARSHQCNPVHPGIPAQLHPPKHELVVGTLTVTHDLCVNGNIFLPEGKTIFIGGNELGIGGGTSFVDFKADADLDMNCFSIENVASLSVDRLAPKTGDTICIIGSSGDEAKLVVKGSDDSQRIKLNSATGLGLKSGQIEVYDDMQNARLRLDGGDVNFGDNPAYRIRSTSGTPAIDILGSLGQGGNIVMYNGLVAVVDILSAGGGGGSVSISNSGGVTTLGFLGEGANSAGSISLNESTVGGQRIRLNAEDATGAGLIGMCDGTGDETIQINANNGICLAEHLTLSTNRICAKDENDAIEICSNVCIDAGKTLSVDGIGPKSSKFFTILDEDGEPAVRIDTDLAGSTNLTVLNQSNSNKFVKLIAEQPVIRLSRDGFPLGQATLEVDGNLDGILRLRTAGGDRVIAQAQHLVGAEFELRDTTNNDVINMRTDRGICLAEHLTLSTNRICAKDEYDAIEICSNVCIDAGKTLSVDKVFAKTANGPIEICSDMIFDVGKTLSVDSIHPTTPATVTVEGNLQVNGVITQISDDRLKTKIDRLDLEDAYFMIQRLRPVEYKLIQDLATELNLNAEYLYGFLADELERTCSNLVETDAQRRVCGQMYQNFKRVNYIGIIAHLVAALQRAQQKLDFIASKQNTIVEILLQMGHLIDMQQSQMDELQKEEGD